MLSIATASMRCTLSLVLLATIMVGLLQISVAAAEQAAGDEAVVPEGQEELLAQILGKGETLADGCKLQEGRVEYTTVKATYACPQGEVVFELTHPSRAGGGASKTDKFAVVLQSGSPPDGLLPALLSHIRSREAPFEWKLIGAPSAARWPSTTILVGGGLLAVALLGGVLRSRSSARRAGSS